MEVAAARLATSVPVAGPMVGMATGLLTKNPLLFAQGTFCLTLDTAFAAQDAYRVAVASGAVQRFASVNAATGLDAAFAVARQVHMNWLLASHGHHHPGGGILAKQLL